MQIVAQGAQDKYLTVDPEITFFKSMYRRHTNFAIESIEQTFNGTVGAGGKVSATISRNGDLVHRMWLEVTLPEVAIYTGAGLKYLDGDKKDDNVKFLNGEAEVPGRTTAADATNNTKRAAGDLYSLIDNISVEIGGTRVDRHYSAWMKIYDDLTLGEAGDATAGIVFDGRYQNREDVRAWAETGTYTASAATSAKAKACLLYTSPSPRDS